MYFDLRAGKALLFCWMLLGVVAAPQTAARAQEADVRAGQTVGRTGWDEKYLYLAFQVDDPNLAGTNTTPLSRPEQDDSVGVYLQVGDARPDTPDANTHAMLVSVAGGFTFLRGGAGGFTVRPLRDLIPIKFAVTLQGTLNRADDADQRFTVEMAIPWEVVGVTPRAGMALGYNVVVRSREGGFTSLAGDVTTAADINAPSKWTRLTLGAPAPAAPSEGRFAPRITDRPPLIEGILRAGEWPEAPSFAFAAPEKARPVAAVAPVPGTTPGAAVVVPPLPTDQPIALERLLLARYALQFQGDPRKPTTFRGVRAPGGRFLLSDQPALGAGPWFSSDRPGWHRPQLAEMRRLGVDVALTVTGGPEGDQASADEKALLVLVGALREMATERIPAPQIALWLDTESLVPAGSPRPDLTAAEGRALLYRAVRRYFQIIPPELRARVQLPINAGGIPAYPVFLSSARGFSALDGRFVDDLRSRFAADFGADSTLIIAGGEDFAASGARLAAFLPVETGGKGSGAVASYVVQPGYDNGAVARSAALVPRREGQTYRAAWEAALAAKPTWLVLDSWNDYARGTEVAPSRQYGTRYVDQTRIHALQFNGLQPRDIKWLAHNAPRRMRPQQVVSVEVLLQNAGATPLRAPSRGPGAAPVAGAALSYRWLQNGKVVAASPLRLPLVASVFPTQVARLSVGLAAVREEPTTGGGAAAPPRLVPLPPGEYVVQVDMTETGADGKPIWFGENGDTPLSFAVTVTPDAAAGVTFEGITVPPLLKTGDTYPVSLRLRWLGDEPLAADAALLTWQLLPPAGEEAVATGSLPLAQSLPPGQMTTVRVPLRLADSGGNAVPTAFPEARGGYRLRWLLTRTQATVAIPGVYSERVALYPQENPAHISVANAPAEMDAEALADAEVTVVNRGLTKWVKGEFRVGYHWFYPDGVEAVWKGLLSAPIPTEVEPGRSVKVRVPVRAPERDGEYVLAFDLTRGQDTWLSTLPLTRIGDLGLTYVRVRGGRLTFLDLQDRFNLDGMASEAAPGDGDLDGKGGVLPSESFPPDRFGLVAPLPAAPKKRALPSSAYPSGYYADVSPSARMISFRYGAQAPGAQNAVACAGQVLPVPRGRYVGLHLAALSTAGEDRPLPLVLRYKDGTSEAVTRLVGDWNRPPTDREAVAALAHRKRTRDGDLAGVVCALRHIIVPVSVGKELISVTLPNDPAVKIFAMTLER